MRDPRINPKPGDWLGKTVKNRPGVYCVRQRHVLALEKRYLQGVIVVWTAKRKDRPFRSTLVEWRAWARDASKVIL